MKTPVWAPVALVLSIVANALLLSVYFSSDESTAALLGSDGVGPPSRESKLMFLPAKYSFVENSIKNMIYSPAAKVPSQLPERPGGAPGAGDADTETAGRCSQRRPRSRGTRSCTTRCAPGPCDSPPTPHSPSMNWCDEPRMQASFQPSSLLLALPHSG